MRLSKKISHLFFQVCFFAVMFFKKPAQINIPHSGKAKTKELMDLFLLLV